MSTIEQNKTFIAIAKIIDHPSINFNLILESYERQKSNFGKSHADEWLNQQINDMR